MESICSGCKKQMIPSVRYLVNNEKVFYKTCDKCRAKRKNLYFLTQKLKDDRIYPPATNTKNMECYICFNNYTEGVKGVDCKQCKKSCCDKCYLKMYIKTHGCIKCGLCRFQENSEPIFDGINNITKFFDAIQIKARECGYSYKKSREYVHRH